jgi:hypothetical protein
LHKAWAFFAIRLEFHWVINSLKPPADCAKSGARSVRAEILADTLKGAAKAERLTLFGAMR